MWGLLSRAAVNASLGVTGFEMWRWLLVFKRSLGGMVGPQRRQTVKWLWVEKETVCEELLLCFCRGVEPWHTMAVGNTLESTEGFSLVSRTSAELVQCQENNWWLAKVFVLVMADISMIKYHDKNQLGEGRVYLAYLPWITVHWGKPRQVL